MLHVPKRRNTSRERENSSDQNDNSTQGQEESEMISSTTSHPDERQIKLDTDRSFVLYPVGETATNPRR